MGNLDFVEVDGDDRTQMKREPGDDRGGRSPRSVELAERSIHLGCGCSLLVRISTRPMTAKRGGAYSWQERVENGVGGPIVKLGKKSGRSRALSLSRLYNLCATSRGSHSLIFD